MAKASQMANDLWPYLLPKIQRTGGNGHGGSGGGGGGGLSTPASLATLTDVLLTAPANGDLLAYQSSSAKWVNVAGGGGGSVYFAGDGIDITAATISVK